MIHRLSRTLFILSCICLFATGCMSNSKEFMPDQVIENALRDNALISYYAESESVFYENDEIQSTSTAKEWFRKDGWTRMETMNEDGEVTILTKDPDLFKVYDNVSNELIEIRSSELNEDVYSPKEEVQERIEFIQETHDISYIGEEKIIGRNAHHILAVPRDQTSLLGEQEFWFDAEHWIVLKSITMFGDSRDETKYTHFEVNDDMEDHLFDIEVTDEMTVIDFDDLMQEAELSLEDMAERMDRPFMYFEETDDLVIESINSFDMAEEDFAQYTFEYTKDGLPYVSLTIMESEPLPSFFEEVEELDIGGEKVFYSDEYNRDVFEWNISDVQYEAWVNDPSVTKDEMIQMLEQLFEQNELLEDKREEDAS